jgi:hypothetical protein
MPPPQMSVNFSRALFLMFDDGADRLSWNSGKELPLYTA